VRDDVGQELSGLLELLYEGPGLQAEQLPPPLAELYDGELGFGEPKQLPSEVCVAAR
jgi:hypothetical protein